MRHLNSVGLVLFAAAVSGSLAVARAERPPIQPRGVEIAFLEDCNGDETARDSARVRLAFRSVAGGWMPVAPRPTSITDLHLDALQLSARRSWQALRDGHVVGSTYSEGEPDCHSYGDFGMQRLAGPLPTFALGPRTERYAGWDDAPRRRPVVLVSVAPHGNLDVWKATRLAVEADSDLVWIIRNSVSDLARCGEDSNGDTLRFTAQDLRVAEAYVSRNGDRLVAFVVREGADVCNGFGGTRVGPFWFFVQHRGSRRFIADQMSLIDRADLNGDGHTEFLFWYSGYNEDGYRVYWDGFAKSAEFTWNYH